VRRSAQESGRPARSFRPVAAAAVLAAAASGCAWSLLPPTSARGEATNVVLDGGLAYVALGERGLGVYHVESRSMVEVIAPEAGAESVDDLALADGLLFALDARAPGHLSVYRLTDPRRPLLVSGPMPVPVEPFSGVSAAAGRVVVSGGTKNLTVASYGEGGALAGITAAASLGRGQPDVLLAPDGAIAWVSTHFSWLKATYGVTGLRLETPPASPTPISRLELDGAGFTPGAAKPANFPLESALDGHTLLVAFGAGLAAIDVVDPAAPRLLSVTPLPVRPVNVDAAGGHAAVVGSDPAPRLVLVDVRDPSVPRLERTVDLPSGSSPVAVALGGRHVVVAARAGGVVVVDR